GQGDYPEDAHQAEHTAGEGFHCQRPLCSTGADAYSTFRDGNERRPFASSSPMNSSLVGSRRSLRLSSHDSAAAWQAMCERRITCELAAGRPRDFTQSKKLRAWADTSRPVSCLSPSPLSSSRS